MEGGGAAGPAALTVTVSQAVVSQAGFVVGLEAQVVLLALGSGLAGAPVVSQPPEDYGKALSPAAVTSGLLPELLEGGTQSGS